MASASHAESRRYLALAAASMALATVIGAFGAHLLRARLSEALYATLQTAVHYQFFHSLGLLLLAMLAGRSVSPALRAALALLGTGIVLFSGSLYLLVAGAPRAVAFVTPVGGLCLIAAWLLAAAALWRLPAGGGSRA